MSLPRSKHKRNGGGRKKGNLRRKDKKPTGQEPDRVQCVLDIKKGADTPSSAPPTETALD
jgi:hypothetical protein